MKNHLSLLTGLLLLCSSQAFCSEQVPKDLVDLHERTVSVIVSVLKGTTTVHDKQITNLYDEAISFDSLDNNEEIEINEIIRALSAVRA